MAIDIRLPNITAQDTAGKTAQMQSYLYQLAEQLNWALGTIEAVESGNSPVTVKSAAGAMTEQEQKDALETFNRIKGLIIKSADIVQAYQDIYIEKFNTLYTAKGDFGNFEQAVNTTITQTADDITQQINELQRVVADEFEEWRESQAYLRYGKLDDITGIAGIEIGQTITQSGAEVFQKMARFTSEGISFYVNGGDEPLAKMTATDLVIVSADIQDLKLGGYHCDTSNGIAFKWVGRSV